MRRSPLVSGSLLLLSLTTLFVSPALPQTRPGPERAYPIPKTLTMTDATQPIWVDASVALTETGEPNHAVFGEYTGRITELLQKPPAEGCRDPGPAFEDAPNPPPRATLEDAIGHSDVALLGRVTGKAFGFYSYAPGQLLQIEPLRSYGYRLSKPRYYVFVPVARFRFGGVEICKSDDRYAEPPDIGGELFLFVFKPADPTGVLLDTLNAGDIVPVGGDGSLRLPRQYIENEQEGARRASQVRTKSALLAEIQAMRARGAHQ
jgi:hypothetical protein